MGDRDKQHMAAFRAKLNQKQRLHRIDSPLVRYNEYDKPVCRVCNVVLKGQTDWELHQVSSRHTQAIKNLKASISSKNAVNSTEPETASEVPKAREDDSQKFNGDKPRVSSDVKKSRAPSTLPADFFDDQGAKRQKVGSGQDKKVDVDIGVVSSKTASPGQTQLTRTPENTSSSRTKPTKGAIPEGFFDNKEADLRARGIEPVKPDVKDEYKEFEKLIQQDLAEVDNRFEEEEIDAAEQIEEEEVIEQRTYRDRVEELKRKKRELIAGRPLRAGGTHEASESKSNEGDESSSEDEEDGSFAVDWRAQHL